MNRLGVGGVIIGWLAIAQVCPAQQEADGQMKISDWHISAGVSSEIYLYNHDALQQRADYINKDAKDWENGRTDGMGYGLRLSIGRTEGVANFIYRSVDYTYELDPIPGAHHEIESGRRDVDVSWWQTSGSNEKAFWGWDVGYRYIGLRKQDYIQEIGASITGDGDVTWHSLYGGYFGEIRPFGGDIFNIHGNINLFLGEAGGDARTGNDTNWADGVISETYDREHSLGYGANATLGAGFKVYKDLNLSIEYRREWLYSFDATTSGVVVFPDNDDALFIENSHLVIAHLDYTF